MYVWSLVIIAILAVGIVVWVVLARKANNRARHRAEQKKPLMAAEQDIRVARDAEEKRRRVEETKGRHKAEEEPKLGQSADCSDKVAHGAQNKGKGMGVMDGLDLISSLSDRKDPQAISELSQLLYEEESLIVSEAAEALGEMGDSSVVPDLIHALEHPEWTVRSKVASTLGAVGDETALPALKRLAEGDSDSNVRGWASDACKDIQARCGSDTDRTHIPRYCGECGKKEGAGSSLSQHLDKRYNRVLFCQECSEEREEDLLPDSCYRVFECGHCGLHIMAGSSIDRSGVCSVCNGSLNNYFDLDRDERQ